MLNFKSYGNIALLVSHDEAFRMSDRIAVMNCGTIEAIDMKHELFNNLKTLSATLLTGCKNISTPHIENDFLISDEWNLKFKIDKLPLKIKFVGFRAKFIEYSQNAGENTILMEVIQVIEDTFSYLIMVRHKNTNGKLIRWEVDKKIWRSIQSPEIYLYFSPDKLMLLEK